MKKKKISETILKISLPAFMDDDYLKSDRENKIKNTYTINLKSM